MEFKKTLSESFKEALADRIEKRNEEAAAKEPAIWGLTKDKTPKKPIRGL